MGPGMFSGGEGFLVEVLLNLNVEKRDGYDGRKWWHLTGNPGGINLVLGKKPMAI